MRIVATLLFLASLALSSHEAAALPRFAVQYGQSCHLCHVNPAGGGLRTSYGSQFFAGTELAGQALDLSRLELLNPKLGERVEIGLDFRGMALLEHQDKAPRTSLARHERSTFFLMQGDLYLGLKVRQRVQVVLERGLHGVGENFALLQVLPWHGSLKAGRFLPNVGWRWADHDTAVRRALGYGPGQADTGLEAELHPNHFSLSLAVGNDATITMDSDRGKAATARVLWQGQPMGHSLSLGAALRVSDRAPADSRVLAALLAGWSRGPWTWTAELDQVEEGGVTSLAHTQELAFRLRRGLDLTYGHDFLDPDTDQTSGLDRRHRLGVDWVPVPGLAIQPALSLLRHEESEAHDNWFQAELQLYLFM